MGRWSRPVAEAALVWLGLSPGLTWLDVGCGTGALTQAILDTADPRANPRCRSVRRFRRHRHRADCRSAGPLRGWGCAARCRCPTMPTTRSSPAWSCTSCPTRSRPSARWRAPPARRDRGRLRLGLCRRGAIHPVSLAGGDGARSGRGRAGPEAAVCAVSPGTARGSVYGGRPAGRDGGGGRGADRVPGFRRLLAAASPGRIIPRPALRRVPGSRACGRRCASGCKPCCRLPTMGRFRCLDTCGRSAARSSRGMQPLPVAGLVSVAETSAVGTWRVGEPSGQARTRRLCGSCLWRRIAAVVTAWPFPVGRSRPGVRHGRDVCAGSVAPGAPR